MSLSEEEGKSVGLRVTKGIPGIPHSLFKLFCRAQIKKTNEMVVVCSAVSVSLTVCLCLRVCVCACMC